MEHICTNGAEKTRARRQSRDDRTQIRQRKTEEKGWWTFIKLSSCRLSLSSSSRRDVLGLDLENFCCRYGCLVRSASQVRWSHCRDRQTKTCVLLAKMHVVNLQYTLSLLSLLPHFEISFRKWRSVIQKHDAMKRNAKHCYKVYNQS